MIIENVPEFTLGIIFGVAITLTQAPRLYKKGVNKGEEIGFRKGRKLGAAEGKSDMLAKFNEKMTSSRMYFMSDM